MAKDRDIKYAEYDYGQPEREKKGLFIRSRSGDNRVIMFAVAFFVIPLVIGGLFAIPGVRDYFDGRENLAEIAIGDDYFDMDECVQAKRVDLAALHQAESLEGATAVRVTVFQQTRSKGNVANASTTISLEEMDLANLPTNVSLGLSRSDFEVTAPNSSATQCAYEIEIVS